MAVTTMASVESGFLPTEIGPGPYPATGEDSWYSVRNSLISLRDNCVRNNKGGVSWYRKF